MWSYFPPSPWSLWKKNSGSSSLCETTWLLVNAYEYQCDTSDCEIATISETVSGFLSHYRRMTEHYFPFKKINKFTKKPPCSLLSFWRWIGYDMIVIGFDLKIFTCFLLYRLLFHLQQFFFNCIHLIYHSCLCDRLYICLNRIRRILVRMHFCLIQYSFLYRRGKSFSVRKAGQFIH